MTEPINMHSKSIEQHKEAIVGLSLEILQSANESKPRPEFLWDVLQRLSKTVPCEYAAIQTGEPGQPGYCRAVLSEKGYVYRQTGMPENKPPEGRDIETPESVIHLPLVHSGNRRGRLELGGSDLEGRDIEMMQRLGVLGQMIGLALTIHDTQSELRERVKELSCLYGISQLVEPPNKSLDEILRGATSLLPRAWLHEESAEACIRLGDKTFQTPNFHSGVQDQSADIMIRGEKFGSVTVAYTEEKPLLDEGPFLLEERKLLDNVAMQLSRLAERRRYEEEKKEIRDRLSRANRLALVGQLSASIAHEINEPLTAILGYAELASKSNELPDQVRSDISKILSTSLHARDVVRKILMFSRMMPQKETMVDLGEVIREVLSLIEPRRGDKGIELKVDIAEGADRAFGDPARYRQLVGNLVMNAQQAMPVGGRLTIITRKTRDGLELEISDIGVGMSAETMDKMFIPFYTTKEPGQGTGLGLSVVHDIVASVNGSIKVDSEPGRGTCVRVGLPGSPSR